MKKKLSFLFVAAFFAATFMSCNDDNDDSMPVIKPSDGLVMTLNGGQGGAAAENSVFVDFSADRQDSIKRSSWDLGFYCASDYRVIINHTSGSVAQVIEKTDINSVTEADAAPFTDNLTFTQTGNLANMDDVDGDLTKTVIAAVSATDNENKVYIVRSGAKLNANAELMKVRILRNGNGYTLQYAKLTETSFKTMTVGKDSNKNFVYVSFDNGIVNVEPGKTNWDIEWTASTYKSGTVAYFYSDYVYINSYGGVKVAEVFTSTIDFVDFSLVNVTSDMFNNSIRNLIGSNWRSTNPATGVKTDRFYVIQDPAGNIYKLRFLKVGINNDGGVRGYPQIEYQLVK